jgi:hypothetical protein
MTTKSKILCLRCHIEKKCIEYSRTTGLQVPRQEDHQRRKRASLCLCSTRVKIPSPLRFLFRSSPSLPLLRPPYPRAAAVPPPPRLPPPTLVAAAVPAPPRRSPPSCPRCCRPPPSGVCDPGHWSPRYGRPFHPMIPAQSHEFYSAPSGSAAGSASNVRAFQKKIKKKLRFFHGGNICLTPTT